LPIGSTIHASDVKLPEGVELAADGDVSVVHIVAPQTEEAAAPVAEVAAEAAPAEA